MLVAVIVKEAFFVALLLPASVTSRQPPRSQLDAILRKWLLPRCPAAITPGSMVRDMLGDICLLLFSMLAYSVVWGSITASSPIRSDDGNGGLAYLGLTLFFFMVYLGLRAGHLMQELFFDQERTSRILSALGLLVNYVTVLITYPRV